MTSATCPPRPVRCPLATPWPASPRKGAENMTRSASTDIVLAAFAAVERRDERRLAELYHPEVEFHRPPSLPYAGPSAGPPPCKPATGPASTRSGTPCSQPGTNGAWTRGSSRRPTRRSWCSGTSAAGDRPASGSTWKRWAFTGCGTGSSPGRKCSTSTPPRYFGSSNSYPGNGPDRRGRRAEVPPGAGEGGVGGQNDSPVSLGR